MGNQATDKGKDPPDKGKDPPDKGKGNSQKGQAILGAVTSGAACVVLRASIETFGPAGDAELCLNVKWPSSALAAVSELPAGSSTDSQSCGGAIDSSGNLYLPATHPIPTDQG
jgi:hypothetical protein